MLRKFNIILIIIVILTGCGNKKSSESFTFLALNTTCTITIYDGTKIDSDYVKSLITDIENLMSSHLQESDISKINRGEDFIADISTLEVIKRGLYFSDLSNGIFDISIGPLVDFWNVGERISAPDKQSIDVLLPLVDYHNINIDDKGKVLLENMDMALDLGGIAKGYAADIVKKYLVSMGVKSAIINLGGNINLIGKKIDSSDWHIGIQHPRKDRGEYIGILSLNDTSLVSSGDYERYFEEDGIRYHHILNSKTGYPIDGNFMSSSIIYPKSIDSDALSTITFGSSIEQIKALNSEIPFSGIFISKNKEVYISKNLEDIFTLKDDSYRLITY